MFSSTWSGNCVSSSTFSDVDKSGLWVEIGGVSY